MKPLVLEVLKFLRHHLALGLALSLALPLLTLWPATTGAADEATLAVLRAGSYSADSYEDALTWAATHCDVNYGTSWLQCTNGGIFLCVPLLGYDLDCNQITQVYVAVLGVDWMNLDEDGDGVGCEVDLDEYADDYNDDYQDDYDDPDPYEGYDDPGYGPGGSG